MVASGQEDHARRSRRRVLGLVAAAAAAVAGLAACQPVPTALQLTVTTATDGNDATPGNGVCEVHAGQGDCTLRAAISEANATTGRVAVTIAAGIDPVLSVAGPGEDANATGDLDVTGDVVVNGSGATVDAAGIDRAFDVRSGRLELADVTVTDGLAPLGESGGGLQVAATLVLRRVHVTGNRVQSGGAGTALIGTGATISIVDSQLDDNTAVASTSSTAVALTVSGSTNLSRSTVVNPSGNAITTNGVNLVVTDSTLEGLRAVDSAYATTVVLRSTLVGTDNGNLNWLLENISGSLQVGGSVLDQPFAQADDSLCYPYDPKLTSLGWNVAADDSCGLTDSSDLQGVSVLLHAIADNGGPATTALPASNSPVLDRIPAGTTYFCDGAADQRGVARPAGGACDVGAVEGSGDPIDALHLTVDSAADGVDAVPGDGICATATGACTLRAAVVETNSNNAEVRTLPDVVMIASGIAPTLTIRGAGEGAAATGDLDVRGALVVEGGGTTITGDGHDRVFDIVSQETVLRELTVTGGAIGATGSAGAGGGLRVNGSLEIDHVTVRGNTAGGDGGGIWGSSRRVAVVDSDIDGNTAAGYGGGISGQLVAVRRSTIRNNHAGATGGALGTPNLAYATVEDSTLSWNEATGGGGAVAMAGALEPGVTLVRTTVADNVGSPSLKVHEEACTRGCITWAGVRADGSILAAPAGTAVCDDPVAGGTFNLVSDGTCGASVAGSSLLGPLADNGGPTLTHLPGAGSGAIDAVPSGTATLCAGALTDQRGVARPQGVACDIGAVELAAPQ